MGSGRPRGEGTTHTKAREASLEVRRDVAKLVSIYMTYMAAFSLDKC